MVGQSLCEPMAEPTKYANVSLAQVPMNMTQIIAQPKSNAPSGVMSVWPSPAKRSSTMCANG